MIVVHVAEGWFFVYDPAKKPTATLVKRTKVLRAYVLSLKQWTGKTVNHRAQSYPCQISKVRCAHAVMYVATRLVLGEKVKQKVSLGDMTKLVLEVDKALGLTVQVN